MNKIIIILLVGLFVCSGCGDDNDGTSAVGEAIPVAPYGVIHENPTYKWHSLQWATRYHIVVVRKYSTEAPIIEEEYTAEEAGCESGGGLCVARPVATFSKSSDWQWKVRACTNDECDYWSEPLDFKTGEDWGDPTPLVGGGGDRFINNDDGTVYDEDTGLTWLWRSDNLRDGTYAECATECERLRRAEWPTGPPTSSWCCPYLWRVPESHELASLYYAVPRQPLGGELDFAGFFDGKPFYSYWVASFPNYRATFWTSTIGEGASGETAYIGWWFYNQTFSEYPCAFFYASNDLLQCWCVGRPYPPEAFDWIP